MGAGAGNHLSTYSLACNWSCVEGAVRLKMTGHARFFKLRKCSRALFQFGVRPCLLLGEAAEGNYSLHSHSGFCLLKAVTTGSSSCAEIVRNSGSYVISAIKHHHLATSID